MNKMMMSNKQKKLYERMKYSEKKKSSEVRLTLGCLSGVNYFLLACGVGGQEAGASEAETAGGQDRVAGTCRLRLFSGADCELMGHMHLSCAAPPTPPV
jgi:hypothetical protein